MKDQKRVYVVVALRYGLRSNGSYTVAVTSTLDLAKKIADSHIDFRGGKYDCIVELCIMDEFDNMGGYTHEVYRANFED